MSCFRWTSPACSTCTRNQFTAAQTQERGKIALRCAAAWRQVDRCRRRLRQRCSTYVRTYVHTLRYYFQIIRLVYRELLHACLHSTSSYVSSFNELCNFPRCWRWTSGRARSLRRQHCLRALAIEWPTKCAFTLYASSHVRTYVRTTTVAMHARTFVERFPDLVKCLC